MHWLRSGSEEGRDPIVRLTLRHALHFLRVLMYVGYVGVYHHSIISITNEMWGGARCGDDWDIARDPDTTSLVTANVEGASVSNLQGH